MYATGKGSIRNHSTSLWPSHFHATTQLWKWKRYTSLATSPLTLESSSVSFEIRAKEAFRIPINNNFDDGLHQFCLIYGDCEPTWPQKHAAGVWELIQEFERKGRTTASAGLCSSILRWWTTAHQYTWHCQIKCHVTNVSILCPLFGNKAKSEGGCLHVARNTSTGRSCLKQKFRRITTLDFHWEGKKHRNMPNKSYLVLSDL